MQDLATVARLGAVAARRPRGQPRRPRPWPARRPCWPGPRSRAWPGPRSTSHGFDDGDGSGPIPPALDLPGLLQFGGLKAAAALSAPAPLRILHPGPGFAKAWPETAYELSGSPQAFTSIPKGSSPRPSPGGSTGASDIAPSRSDLPKDSGRRPVSHSRLPENWLPLREGREDLSCRANWVRSSQPEH